MSTLSTYEYLRELWNGTFGSPCGFHEVMHWYDGKCDRRRHYHTADHVARCLSELSNLLLGEGNVLTDETVAKVDSRVARAALFFHDVCYDPASGLNEAKSVAVFRSCAARSTWSDECQQPVFVEAVSEAIMTTRHLEPTVEAPSSTSRLVADGDVIFLGKGSRAELAEYEAAVRREFDDYAEANRSVVPVDEQDDVYSTRRSHVLTRLHAMAADRCLYKTPEISARYSGPATTNLAYILGLVEGWYGRRTP